MPYLTPDAPPDDLVCLQIRIPNDITWIGIVKGALSELLLSYNFEPFGDYTPAETVQRFIAMYDDFVFSECDMGCCYDIVERRATSDGELQIRINGGDWQQDPNDPRLTGSSLPPPVLDETHTKCDAATNGQQHLQDYIAAYSEALGAASSIVVLAGEVALLIVAILIAPESAPLILPLLFAAASAAFLLGQAAWDSYFTSDVYDDILCALYCNIGDDGQFTDEQYTAFVDKLQADMPDGVAKDTFINSVIAMGAKGINNMCSYGESADADCSSCDCTDAPCDYSTWDIWLAAGTLISRNRHHIIAAAANGGDGHYYLNLCSPAPDTCCCYVTYDSGGVGMEAIGYNPCGSSQADGSHLGFAYTNQSANAFAFKSNAPFTLTLSSTDPCS